MNEQNGTSEREDLEPAPSANVRLGRSDMPGAGRGVFARVPLMEGECVEVCPVVPLERRDRARLRRTELVNYYFLWGERRDGAAIALGFGSLYNHSYEPNLRYEKHTKEALMAFYALRDIAEGEELTINYNGTPEDTATLWIAAIPPANAAHPRQQERGLISRIKDKLS